MCEHIKDDHKDEVFVSLLCSKCAANEVFDQKQIELFCTKTVGDYRKLFLK